MKDVSLFDRLVESKDRPRFVEGLSYNELQILRAEIFSRRKGIELERARIKFDPRKGRDKQRLKEDLAFVEEAGSQVAIRAKGLNIRISGAPDHPEGLNGDARTFSELVKLTERFGGMVGKVTADDMAVITKAKNAIRNMVKREGGTG
jgi:hypothetical protein